MELTPKVSATLLIAHDVSIGGTPFSTLASYLRRLTQDEAETALLIIGALANDRGLAKDITGLMRAENDARLLRQRIGPIVITHVISNGSSIYV